LVFPPTELFAELPTPEKSGVDDERNAEGRRERISHGEIAKISRFSPVHLSKSMPQRPACGNDECR
jgi:hypothetical protein